MASLTFDNDSMLRCAIASDPELSDFIQLRPIYEDLGESLDLYEQHLNREGRLSQSKKDLIRGIHIKHQANLLRSELPIRSLSEINVYEDDIIREFCGDQNYLYNTRQNEDQLRDFAATYQSVNSPFVNYNMAKIFHRHHMLDKSVEYYDKALRAALFSIDEYWNNPESVYACSEFLFDIVTNKHLNMGACNEMLFGKILEYTYLVLSRVILWPENSDGRFDNLDIPITYRHKISSLNKRAEILLDFKDYFENMVPSYSTSEILSIADYSSAHDFAFSGKQTGLKSLFKRDAEKLYENLSNPDVRPFATAIIDAKKDSIELAYRFYLKFKRNYYQVSNDEYTNIFSLFKDIVFETHIQSNKTDANEIRKFLSDNGIEYFYHFTERENIDNIKKNGGICSLKHCLLNAIEVSTKGDMTLLRDTDARAGLEDYARLSFCERHPLIKKRQESGADLVLLKINKDIAWKYDTLFSDRDAALPNHQHGEKIEDLKKVKMNAVRKNEIEEWDPDYEYNQAEVMVKSIVPIEYIENIDKPIEISNTKSNPPKDKEVCRKSLIKAIDTIVYLGELFRNSSFLMAMNDGRNERKRITMYSFAGILGYLFETEYSFGDFSSIVDKDILLHYHKIKSTMSDPDSRANVISDLANNWSDILQTIVEIENSQSDEKRFFIGLQSEIDNVTNAIEIISGAKCRKPTIGYAKILDPIRTQFDRDMFSYMVEDAGRNPLSITNEPTLQRYPPLPENMDGIFRTELLNSYNAFHMQGIGATEIFIGYVCSLVKSYYDNAGYVPKNTIDAIIEKCDNSVKGTQFRWKLPSVDELKFLIYQKLLS